MQGDDCLTLFKHGGDAQLYGIYPSAQNRRSILTLNLFPKKTGGHGPIPPYSYGKLTALGGEGGRIE